MSSLVHEGLLPRLLGWQHATGEEQVSPWSTEPHPTHILQMNVCHPSLGTALSSP